MHILYVYADKPHELNCSKHNCIFPAEAINRAKKHSASILTLQQFISNTPEVIKFGERADIIVIERNLFAETLPLMEFWRVKNKPLVAIFDDGYQVMDETNPAYSFWIKNESKQLADNVTSRTVTTMNKERENDDFWGDVPLEKRNALIQQVADILKEKVPPKERVVKFDIPTLTQFKWGLRMVRGIQVPSQQLADDWKEYNDTYFINNYIHGEKYLNAKPLIPHDDIIVGWHGSRSHFASFTESGVLRSLRKTARKHSNVRILIGGDKKLFDALDLPPDKKIYQSYVPEEQWPSLLKSMDVAIAPLATEYDKRRSWIKVIEYMALGIPWVASDFNTYHALRDYGTLVPNRYDDWESALDKAIKNNQEYKEKAKREPFEFAMEQTYDKNMDKTIELYEKLIQTPYK